MNLILRHLCLLFSTAISIALVSCIKNKPNEPPGLLPDKLITYFGFKITNNSGLSATPSIKKGTNVDLVSLATLA